MDWSAATWWWIASGVLVGAELATGTFYLLMIALGAAAAALAAHAGLGFSAQLLVGALLGSGAVVVWHLRQGKRPGVTPGANRDLNLDIGSRVHVSAWNADGTARVEYRGAAWTARYAGSDVPQAGEHVIRAVEGSELLLGR